MLEVEESLGILVNSQKRQLELGIRIYGPCADGEEVLSEVELHQERH